MNGHFIAIYSLKSKSHCSPLFCVLKLINNGPFLYANQGRRNAPHLFWGSNLEKWSQFFKYNRSKAWVAGNKSIKLRAPLLLLGIRLLSAPSLCHCFFIIDSKVKYFIIMVVECPLLVSRLNPPWRRRREEGWWWWQWLNVMSHLI